MSQRRAVSRESAVRYRNANRPGKAKILDELCAVTGWHRDHARKALRTALVPQVVRPRAPRPPLYGEPVMVALRFCWAVLGAPAGKRLAPVLGELVARLSRLGELTVDDVTAALLSQMSAATIDRRLAPDRAKMQVGGRSHTKPGSLLKDSIPIRTWAQWDEGKPGNARDRSGRPRGGQRRREPLLHVDGDGHRDPLDGEPVGQEQGPEAGVRCAWGDQGGVPVPDPGHQC